MSATQLEAVLSMFEDEGEWMVRVGPQVNAKQISQAVIPIISGLGAKKLTLITPFDTKVFKFNGSHGVAPAAPLKSAPEDSSPPVRKTVQELGGMPSEEDAQDALERFIKQQEQEAAQVQADMQSSNSAKVEFPADAEVEAEAPVKRGPGRPRKTPEALVKGPSSECGRCFGAGKLDGGGQCPVCRGKGAIGKWGRGRR